MRFYKDGELIDSHTKTAGPIAPNTAPVDITRGTSAAVCPVGRGFVPGEYDQVMIFNKALTPDKIYWMKEV